MLPLGTAIFNAGAQIATVRGRSGEQIAPPTTVLFAGMVALAAIPETRGSHGSRRDRHIPSSNCRNLVVLPCVNSGYSPMAERRQDGMSEILIIGLVAIVVVIAMAGLLGRLVGLDDLPAVGENDL
jgi:hypothetical protein